jgi:hypothetical protein
MNVEAEIRDPKCRLGQPEGSFGFLTQQVKAVHKDLLAFEEKTDEPFKKVDEGFDNVDRRFDRLEQKVDGLAKALPGIVGDAVREANQEREKEIRGFSKAGPRLQAAMALVFSIFCSTSFIPIGEIFARL